MFLFICSGPGCNHPNLNSPQPSISSLSYRSISILGLCHPQISALLIFNLLLSINTRRRLLPPAGGSRGTRTAARVAVWVLMKSLPSNRQLCVPSVGCPAVFGNCRRAKEENKSRAEPDGWKPQYIHVSDTSSTNDRSEFQLRNSSRKNRVCILHSFVEKPFENVTTMPAVLDVL